MISKIEDPGPSGENTGTPNSETKTPDSPPRRRCSAMKPLYWRADADAHVWLKQLEKDTGLDSSEIIRRLFAAGRREASRKSSRLHAFFDAHKKLHAQTKKSGTPSTT